MCLKNTANQEKIWKYQVINKNANKMYVLYLNENGDIRSSLSTSAPKEKAEIVEQSRDGGDQNE